MEEMWLISERDRSVYLQKQINEKTVYKTTDGYEFIFEACEHIWECDYRSLVTYLHNNNDNNTALSSSRMLKSIVCKRDFYTPLKFNTFVTLTFVRSIPTLTQTAPTPFVIHQGYNLPLFSLRQEGK